jgi:folate-binding protein YgfZ
VAVDSLTSEYEALTQGVGLVDRSERGKLLLTGADVREFLQGQLTNDVEGLGDGEGCYAAFLTHKGKMLGDLRVFAVGDEAVFVDCERAVLQDLFNMIRRFKVGREVGLEKRTLERGLLSLVGPGIERFDAREHRHRVREIGGLRVREIVTDLGVDVVCDAEDVGVVKEALGVPECSLDTAEIVRVESGRPRYGIDLDDSVIPQEAGLNERAVNFEKGCYVGQETVARLFYRGKPNRRLLGLRSAEPLAPGTELSREGKVVAVVRSSVVSPRLGPIALAFVRREVAVGEELGGARVVDLPFVA